MVEDMLQEAKKHGDLYELDHMFPISRYHILSDLEVGQSKEEDPEKFNIQCAFNMSNTLPTFWGMNAAKYNIPIYHCWVEKATLTWRFYDRLRQAFFTIVELLEHYGAERLAWDHKSRDPILYQDWNSGCDIGLTVAASEEEATTTKKDK
jgi:hypothetical protein